MKKKVSPIKPEGVAAEKKRIFPDEVIEAFNELIASECVNGQATIKQEDVVELMIKKGLNKSDIFGKHWLDVEELYESSGWEVEYDRPGYNENYQPTFTFRKK